MPLPPQAESILDALSKSPTTVHRDIAGLKDNLGGILAKCFDELDRAMEVAEAGVEDGQPDLNELVQALVDRAKK